MTQRLTVAAKIQSSQINEQPQVILVIDGVPTLYGNVDIQKIIRVGDPGLLVGDSWKIGGHRSAENQASYIQIEGTTTQINQVLNQDKGIGSSVSGVQVCLIDKNSEISKLITPGEIVTDILGRRAKLLLGFTGTVYPNDFIVLFRGVIDTIDAGSGNITLNIAHPDTKKRTTIFPKISPGLVGDITNSTTTIVFDVLTNIVTPITGPDGMIDPSFKAYMLIENELIRFTGVTGGNTLTGVSRGQLGTIAVAHSDGTSGNTFYRLEGNAMDLALKIMLSGWNGPFITGIKIAAYNQIDTATFVQNSLFFAGIDLVNDYGLNVGDYISASGSISGGNNDFTLKQIIQIVQTDGGSYAVLNAPDFTTELMSTATADFRSQYDTLGDGLQMFGDEVDVAQHQLIFRRFLSSFQYDIYMKDDVDAKKFLDDEIYNPAACYSLPRNGQSSVGFHIGPIPTDEIKTLNKDNIMDPKMIKISRSFTKNFYNTIIYQFEENVLDTNFTSGDISINASSQTQIPVGNKAMTIPSKGLRVALAGKNLAAQASTRRLNRYAFGAEYFKGVKVHFRVGFNIEIGDIVIFNSAGLFITDSKTGTRNQSTKLYEVVNKSLDYKQGSVQLDLVDTNYSAASRYGLIGPSSVIKAGLSTSKFIIQKSFSSVFGDNEYFKWIRYFECPVKVRNLDFSILGHGIIGSIAGNQITLKTALAFTPAAGYIMELDDYTNQTDEVKLRNAFMRDSAFGDGKPQYQML